jgi:LEA14-like dessication related protein
MNFKTIIYVGLGFSALYGISLMNWGKEIGNKVGVTFKTIKGIRLINAAGEKLRFRDLVKLTKLSKISIEFYITMRIDNGNEFLITMSELAGDVSYGDTKLAKIESVPAFDFLPGKTEYSVKVIQPVLEDLASIAKILSSGDLVRKANMKGEYTVNVQGKTFTIPFNEQLSIEDF